MVRVGQALTSLARDPFPFLLVVLTSRLAQEYHWYWLAGLIGPGYCVSVFLQALRADAAPPLRSRDLPRTAYLGCMGGCGLYIALLLAMAVIGCCLGLTGMERYNPTSSDWSHPLGQAFTLICAVWLTQASFCAICLACGKVRGQDKGSFNGFFVYWFSLLKRPPLSGSGLRLALLLMLTVVAISGLECHSSTLVQHSWLIFATLYAHCLGQYVRKVHGFQLL